MYLRITTLLFVFITFLSSCDEETSEIKKPTLRPIRVQEVGYKRELIYDNAGQVTKVISESQMADGALITSVIEFEYRDGKVVSSTLDDTYRFEYTWDGDRITNTEEIERGVPLHKFIFNYQSNGSIKEMLSYEYEGAEPKLTGKISYAFDVNGNLSSAKEFSYTDNVYTLQSIYEYDRYDNAPSVDAQFDFHSLNTGLQLHKNNPGRMISKNKNGVTSSIEDYFHEYDPFGNVVKRETTVTFLHTGATGSYQTQFIFEQI